MNIRSFECIYLYIVYLMEVLFVMFFKVFDLPSLKAKTHKYKLTATEGAKVRRVGFVNFRSRSDERYHENDLAILTNQGDVQVFTVPSFKRQLKAECVRKENVRLERCFTPYSLCGNAPPNTVTPLVI